MDLEVREFPLRGVHGNRAGVSRVRSAASLHDFLHDVGHPNVRIVLRVAAVVIYARIKT